MSNLKTEKELAKTVTTKLADLKNLSVIKQIQSRLEKELPANLVYHSLQHTEGVMHDVVLFALYDQLKEREIELLAIAAAYHDSGFLIRNQNNEALGAQFAVQAMTSQGSYSESEISTVSQMILDTALVETQQGVKQISHHYLANYLLDADLSNFGRDDFFLCLEKIKQELTLDQTNFYQQTLTVFKNHQWLTKAGRELRQKKKEENLEKLIHLISK